MKEGTRAIWFAVAVLLLAAALAYFLQDGGIFTTATSTSVIGKFGYDAARDVTKGRSSTSSGVSSDEERGD